MKRANKVVVQDRDVLGGMAVFAGTRVPVHALIDHLKAGESLQSFLDDFPSVTREQAVAFLDLAEAAVVEEMSGASPAR
jgi:uncharacterized protein (DUF433 family)